MKRLLILSLFLLITFSVSFAENKKQESAYQRVLRSGTITCGYTSWAPLFFVDGKTNEKKGIFHDLMEEAAKRLDLKIVWQEELGWGSVTEAVKSGRVDMACAGYWLNPGRIKNLRPSVAQLYSPMYIYIRADDKHHFIAPNELDNAQYTVSLIDGSADADIIKKQFSHSKIVALPELSSTGDSIQNVITKKADFILLDSASAAGYEANNPGKLKNVFPDTPMNLFPTIMLLPPEDPAFATMIDNILLNIEYDGTLDMILKKYDAEKLFLRNPKPMPRI